MPTYGKIASLPSAMRNAVNQMLGENVPESEIAEKSGRVLLVLDVHEVESTCLSHMGYDIVTKTLQIVFRKSVKLYQYENVPYWEYLGLISASSIGHYYNQCIKGKY